jgi:poly(hydroxyalkanoate) granule-associated protein
MTTKQPQRSRRAPALRESVEQVWLAGLGALAVAEQEGSRMFRNLVKKGEGLEQASRARLRRVTARAEGMRSDTIGRVTTGFDDAMTSVLHRIGVPTAREIDSLTRRIESLTSAMAATPKRGPARTAAGTTRKTTARRTGAPRRAGTAASRSSAATPA